MSDNTLHFRVEFCDRDSARKERYLKENILQAVTNTNLEHYTVGVYDANGVLIQTMMAGTQTGLPPHTLWEEEGA